MSRARAAGVVLVLVLAALWPAAARAGEVSAKEFQGLVEARDLDGLRQVDSVDGQAVDVAAALQGVRGDELDQRLSLLIGATDVAQPSGNPRADAKQILSESRFHEKEVRGPFKGILERIADWLPSFDWLDDLLPGGPGVMWIVLAAVLAVVVFLVSRRILSGRVREAGRAAAQAAAERAADPKALDREADEAERAGDLELALRLRFRAGLLRLDRRGAIAFRPSISTREVRGALRSDEFDGLAATFDDVVYGGRDAATEDVEQARERWPDVIAGTKR